MTKPKKLKVKKGRSIGNWKLIDKLGAGGNGDVWKVVDSKANEYAIKVLRNIDQITYNRFKSEVYILKHLNIDGVMNIVESFIPDTYQEGTPWFVMPLANAFDEYLIEKQPLEVVSDFLKLAKTIEVLHQKGIVHRDIKPENILFFNNRLFITDFGLVKYPERMEITPKRRDVGAKFTMAPEMRRNADSADGKKADVFSFAKTLWISLTGESKGFDGQYMPSSVLGLKNYQKDIYLTSLDDLLVKSTDNDPNERPTIEEFYNDLTSWLELNRDFQKRNLTEWFELQNKLFPLGAPKSTTWENIDSIVTVINKISEASSLNHMFFPNGGGHTITAASKAKEDGLIALHVGEKIAELIKPKKLTYETFGVDPSWDYFRLEAAEIEPSGIQNAVGLDAIAEALTEVEPGVYSDIGCWEYNEWKGETLSDFARPISRFLKGSFVFVCTASVYNSISGTYDARHDKMSEIEFRDYIQKGAEYFESRKAEQSSA